MQKKNERNFFLVLLSLRGGTRFSVQDRITSYIYWVFLVLNVLLVFSIAGQFNEMKKINNKNLFFIL
jgi:hypothetical protein